MNKYEFKQFIRKYPTYKLLYYFSKLSIEMYSNKESFKFEDIPYYYKNGIKAGTTNFIFTQHEFVNLCYCSILYGNDYRQRVVEKIDAIQLLDKLKNYKNECSISANDIPERFTEFFAILFNEQIEFQRVNSSKKMFNRLCFIMDNINKKYIDHPEYIDFEQEIQEIINMTIQDYNEINLFLTLLSVGSKNPDLTYVLNKLELKLDSFAFNKDDLYNFIDFYSHDYKYYRNLDCGTENWNILKYAPLVKVERNNHILMSNVYSFIICFSTNLYWLIRNKYRKLNSQKFTNYFGFCFEMYVKELLDYYKYKNYKRIPEEQVEQPDWHIELDDYNIIVEQKSTLFTIGSKDTSLINKYEELNKFVKVIKKAMSQLSKYEVDNNKTTIRICLTYEQVDGVESIQELALSDLDISNKELYWLINIDEFEKLICLIKKDYQQAQEVINKKIELEKNNDKNGRSLEKLLKVENDYIKNRLDFFGNISNNIVSKLKIDNNIIS